MSKSTFSSFRGSFIAVVILLGLLLVVLRVDDEPRRQSKTLMSFDPYLLSSIEISRSAQTITLMEVDGQWKYLEVDEAAAMVMVNRVRHQLHELQGRAFVSKDADEFSRYGFDTDAEQVDLVFKDGNRLQLVVGDLNPTGVSHYVLIPAINEVHTVQKAALDYFRYDADLFRENRLVSYSQESVVGILIEPSELSTNKETWVFESTHNTQKPLKRRWGIRIGEANEDLIQSDTSKVSQLIGRLLALKASSFIDPDDNEHIIYSKYDWDSPVFVCELINSKSDSVRIAFGPIISDSNVVVKIGDRDQFFIVRKGVLDDVVLRIEDWASTLLVDVDESSITTLTVSMGDDLIRLRRSADQWLWESGIPVSGSTPDRMVRTLSSLRSQGSPENAHDGDLLCSIGTDNPETALFIYKAADVDTSHHAVTNDQNEGLISPLLFSICQDVERESRRLIDKD